MIRYEVDPTMRCRPRALPAAEYAAAVSRRLERDLRDLGECLWTARDLVSVRDVRGSLRVTVST